MAKAPKDIPAIGDRCQWRGKECSGYLVWVNDRNWAVVFWDAAAPGPKYVHLFELRKIPE